MTILDAVGKTPIIKLENIVKHFNLKGNIYAKLEFFNPGFSKKDRIAKYIIENARKKGNLKNGQEVVEVTSGNTGIGLAIACNIYGHPFTAFISNSVSEERFKILKLLGVNIVKVDSMECDYGKFSGKNFNNLLTLAKDYCKKNNCFFVDQFNNNDNIEAQKIMASEAKEYFKENKIQIDYFVDFIGTGGTFVALEDVFKREFPNVKNILVEPHNASAFKEKKNTFGGHIIQGGGYGKFDLKFMKNQKIDEIVTVKDNEINNFIQLMSKKEGLLGSYSSAANLYAAIKTLEKNPGSNIFMLVTDTVLKYLSHL